MEFRAGDNSQTYRADAYVDRPIYRPVQTVYYHGVFRLDDDASYTLPRAGDTVEVRAFTYGNGGGNGPTAIYTGTAALSAQGTISGQFLIPADAPVGSYSLAFSQPGGSLGQYDNGVTSASFEVQEYRKPDFQVNVTASSSVVHGDPVTAIINTSYYFGGPLQNVTTTVNIQASPYYFSWADPTTGETYKFGEYNPIPYDYYSPIPYLHPRACAIVPGAHRLQRRAECRRHALHHHHQRQQIGAHRRPGAGPQQPDGGRQQQHSRAPGPLLRGPACGRLYRHRQAAYDHHSAHGRVERRQDPP